MDSVEPTPVMSRRKALKNAGALATALGALELTGPLGWAPNRAYAAATPQTSSSTSARS